MKQPILALLMGAALSMLLLGCNNKKDDDGVQVVARGAQRGDPTTTVTNPIPGVNGYSYSAQSVSLTGNQGQYGLQQAVIGFLSSTVAPEDIGQIQSIDMLAQVVVDPNTGNMIPSQSYIQLTIRDNLVTDGKAWDPIVVKVGGRQGVAMNYSTDLIFEDTYGQIRVTGNYNASTFQGTVSFSNVNPSAQGTLGSFSISTCGFFYCIQ